MNRSRRGAALLVVLVTVALALWLALALHAVTIGEQRRATGARGSVIAATAAESGVWAMFRDATPRGLDTLPIGGGTAPMAHAAGSGFAVVRALRTSTATWWLTASGFFPDSTSPRRSERHVGLVARLDLPFINDIAALTVRDAAGIVGSGAVVGSDTARSALAPWCVPASPVAGLAMPDTTRRSGSGVVQGIPPLWQDARAGAMATYDHFGGESWGSLVARASVRLPAGAVVAAAPVVIAGACDTTVATNWGDPSGTGPCRWRAPLVHAAGSVQLRGGRGQGTLLVDGDLTVSGGARFEGVVVVRDDLRTGPGGGVILGAVLAADTLAAPGDHPEVGDALRVERASCDVQGALARISRWRPVARRPWLPM